MSRKPRPGVDVRNVATGEAAGVLTTPRNPWFLEGTIPRLVSTLRRFTGGYIPRPLSGREHGVLRVLLY